MYITFNLICENFECNNSLSKLFVEDMMIVCSVICKQCDVVIMHENRINVFILSCI